MLRKDKLKKGDTILLIDDETSILASIKGLLSTTSKSYNLLTAKNGKEGLQMFAKYDPDVVVVDYKMPEMNGIEFIKAARSLSPNIPIVVLTAHGDKELCFKFISEGAFRYIEKPFDVKEFLQTVEDALHHGKLIQENRKLHGIIELNDEFSEIVGDSKAMSDVYDLINKVCETDVTVLIEGESGTGKELIANAIHHKSEQKDGPFIRFNCSALPENLIESELFGHEKGSFTGADQLKLGRFELANDGTIFLDEIGELSLSMQVKLLRVLQEREFERVGGTSTILLNIRVLAATNRNLQEMVSKGTFRQDLYYRLSVFPITVPPLRDRNLDVLILADYFLGIYNSKYNKRIQSISQQAKDLLLKYHWQGNVRELENVVSRAVILCNSSELQVSHFPIQTNMSSDFLSESVTNKFTEKDLVKKYAQMVFAHCHSNKKETASFLNINFRTLQQRLSLD